LVKTLIKNYLNKEINKSYMALTLMKRIRDVQRFEKILGVLFEEGFGYLLARTKLRRNVPIKQRLKAEVKKKEQIKPEVRLRRTLERLGPTFIKFGQLLSVRPDLIPVSYTIELEKLQDRVSPFSYNEVEKIIIPESIKKLADEREAARRKKNWKKADELRNKIKREGYIIEDTEEGYRIIK